MKHLLWLTLLLLAQAFVPLYATSGADSLRSVLMALPAKERLDRLHELAAQNYAKDECVCVKWFYDEAIAQRNDSCLANALYFLVRHYYANKPDSMRYYIAEAEPLFIKEKRYEDLCRMKAWNIYSLSIEGNQESVMPAIHELVELSQKLNYPEGEEMANQALANYYMKHGLKDEAVLLYKEILSGMENRGAPVIKRFNILRNLLNEDIDPDDRTMFLERMKKSLQECEDKGLTQLNEETSLDYGWYVYYRNLATDAYLEEDKEKARINLEKAEELANRNDWPREKYTLGNIKVYYYQLVGRYNEALVLIDSLLDYFKMTNRQSAVLEMLENKGKIYYKSGLGMKATETYLNYIALKDSVTSSQYYSELANWRSQHDLDKLELKNKQMELDVSKAHSQMMMMGGGLILLLLVCGTLGFITYSRHKYSKQMQLAKEKAEEADNMKSAFLANMNHEIRTPLNAIVGFSQVLVDEDEAEVRQEYLKIIQSNNELLQRLINDVLDLSKIESNTMTLSYFNVYLPEMMDEIYRSTLLRMPEGITLELKECSAINFYTDRMRLTQIITNLLNNAIKHTEKGFIRFGYETLENDLRFYVEDTGEGIPEDKLESIFSRFVQLSDWSKGVGLGLAICRGLILKMGGTITVKSKLGEGSMFSVTLPVHDPPE